MQITYTQTTEELRQRFLPSTSWRQRLNSLWTMTWPVMLCAAAYIIGPGHGFSATILEVTGIVYGVLLLITAASWGLQVWIAHTNKSTSHLAKISEREFLLTAVGGAEQSYLWPHFGSITDLGDYFVFDNERGQHLAIVPKSAFEDDAHAQDFFVQSRRYWEPEAWTGRSG